MFIVFNDKCSLRFAWKEKRMSWIMFQNGLRVNINALDESIFFFTLFDFQFLSHIKVVSITLQKSVRDWYFYV